MSLSAIDDHAQRDPRGTIWTLVEIMRADFLLVHAPGETEERRIRQQALTGNWITITRMVSAWAYDEEVLDDELMQDIFALANDYERGFQPLSRPERDYSSALLRLIESAHRARQVLMEDTSEGDRPIVGLWFNRVSLLISSLKLCGYHLAQAIAYRKHPYQTYIFPWPRRSVEKEYNIAVPDAVEQIDQRLLQFLRPTTPDSDQMKHADPQVQVALDYLLTLDHGYTATILGKVLRTAKALSLNPKCPVGRAVCWRCRPEDVPAVRGILTAR